MTSIHADRARLRRWRKLWKFQVFKTDEHCAYDVNLGIQFLEQISALHFGIAIKSK